MLVQDVVNGIWRFSLLSHQAKLDLVMTMSSSSYDGSLVVAYVARVGNLSPVPIE